MAIKQSSGQIPYGHLYRVTGSFEGNTVLDMALIPGVEKAQLNRLVSHGCGATLTKLREHTEVDQLLSEIQEEEKKADSLFNKTALSSTTTGQEAYLKYNPAFAGLFFSKAVRH